MNSSSAMPISVTLVSCSGSSISPSSAGPDQRAGDDIAEGRAELQPAEQGDEDQRGAEHDRAAFKDCGRRLGRFGGRRHLAASIAASSARNGSRIAPWRRLARARWFERRHARPVAGRRPAPRPSQRLIATSASATSSWARADSMPLRQVPPRPGRRRRRGPAATSASTRRSSSSWTAIAIRLPQVGERSLGATVLALELARLAAATLPAAGSRSCRAAAFIPGAM